ncbi:plastocyanin/azurin family copper-binding protein [Paenibacillus beijingensis]|uniref:plastocyanin/azurin family copper-binding protein n=1 Tax=Paenibacillus beijingensis TaxID=1126833 RepID=UPI0006992137|nr:plastocyanin/azurin family copper-binding protein [Paenibacillus beijingensis]
MNLKRVKKVILSAILSSGLLISASGAAAADAAPVIESDADTAAGLGLLIGEGRGVDAVYLNKASTRLQAAIISLRLQGQLQAALDYTGKTTFADSSQVGKANQPVLAYLKNHPELGWQGSGGNRFDPSAAISAKQFYKVVLENMGFKSGADFTYEQTESFAASKGLTQIAGASSLLNGHIATALVEALSANTANGTTLFSSLQSKGVIAAGASLQTGERIGLKQDSKLGTYFTDSSGKTLYFFTKDAENLNACASSCIANWPIYYSDHLQIPSSLNKADFSVLIRTDGTKQLTYKNWPLYYFVKDKAAGDLNGEAVGGVWFTAKPDYALMLGTSSTAGNYLTDDYGRALYYFDKDTPQKSVCEGTCIANWPAYSSSGTRVPSTVTEADFGTITRPDGSKQSAFKGYPLYYFIQDKAHGDLKGQQVNKVWFTVDPAKFNGTTAASAPAEVKTYRIDIKEFSFGSEPLTVEAGSKVIFTNYDDMKHNAVAVDGSFASPLLAKGESYTVTLDKAGTIDYYCEPHKSFMTGQIIVK